MSIMRFAAAFLLSLSFPAAALAEDTSSAPPGDRNADKGWVIDATPYLWAPSIGGTLRYDTSSIGPGLIVPPPAGSLDLNLNANSLISHLTGGALLTVAAHRGNGMLFTDIMWVNLTGQDAVAKNVTGPLGILNGDVSLSGGLHFASTMWTVGGGYDLVKNSGFSLEGFGGFRSVNVSTSFAWQFAGPIGILNASGSGRRSVTLTDPIVGLRGKLGLGGHWFVPYYGDIGQGGNNDTWQAAGGVGYGYRWGNLALFYRSVKYDMSGNGLLQNVRLSGPGLGATFHL